MNKLITKVAKLVLGLSLAAGVGVAVGGKKVLTASAAENDTHDFSQSIQQVLNNNAAIDSIDIAEQSYKIKQVNVHYRYNKTNNTSVSCTVSVAGDEVDTQYITGTGSDYSNLEFPLATATKGAVHVSFANTGNSASSGRGTLWVDKVTLIEGSSGGSSATQLAAPEPEYDNNSITWGTNANADHFEISIDSGVYATATSPYSTSQLSAGLHTASVKAIGDGTNYTDSPAGEVTFAIFSHAGTAQDPYNVADARNAVDANMGKTGVYVSGIVSKITTAYDSTYHNVSFDMSGDGETTSDQVRGFRTVGTNDYPINSADSVKVGDSVTLHGDLTLYGSTYELAAGNELVYLNRPAVSYTDTFSLAGSHIIFEQQEANGTCYYMNIDNASASVKPSAPTNKANASVFLFTLVGNDKFTITNAEGTMGLYQTGNTNTVCWGASGASYEWLVTDTQAGELYGDYNLIGQTASDNQRYLCVYNNTDWRTYNSATAGNRKAMIQLETPKTISGFSVYTTGADKNVLKGTTFDAAAAAEAGFEARLNYTDSTYDDVTSLATWSLDTSVANNNATLTVSYLSYTPVEITGMNVYVVTFTSLVVDSTGAKTSYIEGDHLTIANLVITAYESNNTEHVISSSECTFSPADGAVLATSNTSVTVSYENENGTTISTSYNITVAAFNGYSKVTSLSDITVGDSYLIGGLNTSNLMGTYSTSGSGSNTKYFRQSVDGSSVVDETHTRVASLPSGAVEVTFLSDGNGNYYIFDMTGEFYLQAGSSTATLKNVSSSENATVWSIEFDATGIRIGHQVDENTTHYLEYNNSSPRFSNYAANNSYYIAVFKKTGSSLKTSVTSFANTSLKMSDPSYEGDISTANCASNYSAMKTAYSNLSEEEKNVFQYSDDYSAARARLAKWATANGETFTYGAANPFGSAKVSPIAFVNENTNAVAIIVIISLVSVTAIGGYFFIKRREQN